MKKILLLEVAHERMSLGVNNSKKNVTPKTQSLNVPILDGKIEDFGVMTKILQDYIRENNWFKVKVKLAIRTSESIVRIVKIPAVKPKDFNSFVQAQLPDLLSVDLKNYVIDYRILCKTKEKIVLLIAALQRNISEVYAQWFESLTIEPVCIDLSINSASVYINTFRSESVLLVVEYMKKITFMLLADEYECIDIYITGQLDGVNEISKLLLLIGGRFEKVILMVKSDWLKDIFLSYSFEDFSDDCILHGLQLRSWW